MPPLPPSLNERLDRLAEQWRPPAQAVPSLRLPEAPAADRPRIPRLDRRSWRVLALLGALALVVIGWTWLQGRPAQVAQVPASQQAVPGASPRSSNLPITGGVVVHVTGAVRKPGLVHLAAGSRVADAVQAAGGVTTARAEGSVNLARVLVDGEQIQVVASGAQTGSAATGKVSLNSASVQQLEELPGVGPVLAQRILDYRTEHGSFRSLDDLNEVSGIGEALLGKLRPHVQV